jgi:RimJ/RimL family protein N-acetyltransferase
MLDTDRLKISELSYDDCEFIFALLNEPAFKRYIGDRNIRTLADAREYLRKGPIGSYAMNGFGLFLVSLREDETPVGICGLVKRDHFELPDLGFAFLEKHWANGYAYESSLAVIEHARTQLSLGDLLAVVSEDNESSIGLLKKVWFRFVEMVCMPGE